MSALSNESCSQYRCVEAGLPVRAVAQRQNKVAQRLIIGEEKWIQKYFMKIQ